MILAFAAAVVWISQHRDDYYRVPSASKPMLMWNLQGLPLILPVISFSFSAHPIIFSVLQTLQQPTPTRIVAVVNQALALSCVIYLAIGVCGYVTFRAAVSGDLLRNYGAEKGVAGAVMRLLKLGYGGSIATGIPLVFITLREALMPSFLRLFGVGSKVSRASKAVAQGKVESSRESSNSTKEDGTAEMATAVHDAALNALLLSLALLAAIAVPNVEFVFGLVGATACSLLIFILPALIFLATVPPPSSYTLPLLPLRNVADPRKLLGRDYDGDDDGNEDGDGGASIDASSSGGGSGGGAGGGKPSTQGSGRGGGRCGGGGNFTVEPLAVVEFGWITRRGPVVSRCIMRGIFVIGVVIAVVCTQTTILAVREEAEVVQLVQDLWTAEKKAASAANQYLKVYEAADKLSKVEAASQAVSVAKGHTSATLKVVMSAAAALDGFTGAGESGTGAKVRGGGGARGGGELAGMSDFVDKVFHTSKQHKQESDHLVKASVMEAAAAEVAAAAKAYRCTLNPKP
jgi:uncharacterized membrane protein YgcG